MFKKKEIIPFNPDTHRAVVHCSICTGEQVAGFKDRVTGKFTEVMLIKNDRDMDDFKKTYHLTDVTKEY